MSVLGAELLAVNTLVSLRPAGFDSEYPSRVEETEENTLVVAAPPGASAVLFASGARDIELSWTAARGRYEQHCVLVEHITYGSLKNWRLLPTGQAMLVQRRRYVRVTAALAVLLVLPGDVVPATTIDVSEGGFRVRMAHREIAPMTPAGIQINIGGNQLEMQGVVLRTMAAGQQTEAVLSFDPTGKESDAIRRFVFQMQLRARAVRQG